MKRIRSYIATNGIKLMFALAICALALHGVVDPGTALAGGIILDTAPSLKELETAMKKAYDEMQVSVRKSQDAADLALAESKKYGGVIEAKTNDLLKAVGEESKNRTEALGKLRDQVVELAQKIGTKPADGSSDAQKSIAQIVAESPEWIAAGKKDDGRMSAVKVGSFHKTQILNATGQNQPLVPDMRLGGIITPYPQRLYIRDVIPAARATSNLIQYASEATFTNNARPQGDASPGNIEGEAFAESAMTFTLANAAMVTLGHFIPASRQVLSDAAMLQGHISDRLLYGMKLVEEQEYLTGDGTAGKINGINNQAAAFTGGATNQTVLDTILKSLLQCSLSNYDADAIIMHPVDWFAAIMLKDTQNRYLFSNPQDMVAPRLWAKPVVPSQSQTSGKFTTGAFRLGAQIWDLEDATIRIAEQHANFFIQGLVAILAEERTTLTVYRTTAFVYGNVSYAG